MADEQARRFFLEPTQTLARHYEILRGYFVEQRSFAELAQIYGLNCYTVRTLVRRFREQCQHGQVPPFLWSLTSDGPRASACSRRVRKCRPLPIAGSSS